MAGSRSSSAIYEACGHLHDELVKQMKAAALYLNEEFLAENPIDAARQQNAFCSALNPASNEYQNNITHYICNYLADELKTEQDFENAFKEEFKALGPHSELSTLFEEPKQVMGRNYTLKTHFGLCQDVKIHNFDEPLKLLFKLKLLQAACLRKNASPLWLGKRFAKLEKLAHVFIAAALRKDKPQLSTLLPSVANTHLAPKVSARSSDSPLILEDDTFDPHYEYGFVFQTAINHSAWPQCWLFYWDAFLPLDSAPVPVKRQDPRVHPLQMEHAQLYAWKERLVYFFFGRDVRKYLKDSKRFLDDGIAIFKSIVHTLIHEKFTLYPDIGNPSQASLQDILMTAWMASNLVNMVFNDIPLALIKGLLGLPFRLLHSISPSNKLHPLIIYTHAAALSILYLVLRLPIQIVLVPLRLAIAVSTAILFSMAMLAAKTCFKLFSSPTDKPSIPAALFKLRCHLQDELAYNPGTRDFYVDKLPILVSDLDAAYQNRGDFQYPETIAALKNKIAAKNTLVLMGRKEQQDYRKPSRSYRIMPGTDKTLALYIRNLVIHEPRIHSLCWDWNFYAQTHKPDVIEIAKIAVQLTRRTHALPKLIFRGDNIKDAALASISRALLHNRKLQIVELAFHSKQLGLQGLKTLLILVSTLTTIQQLSSLPDSAANLDAESAEVYEKIRQQLQTNRDVAEKQALKLNSHELRRYSCDEGLLKTFDNPQAANPLQQHGLMNQGSPAKLKRSRSHPEIQSLKNTP